LGLRRADGACLNLRMCVIAREAGRVTQSEVEAHCSNDGSARRIVAEYPVGRQVGAARREKLVEWSDETWAKELADLLRERLCSNSLRR
jgi:hypothetical protein